MLSAFSLNFITGDRGSEGHVVMANVVMANVSRESNKYIILIENWRKASSVGFL